MNTYMQKKEDIKREWFVIDATDLPLGRLATKAATILRGKHKATFTPHLDCGDNIIIINANKVRLTGNKLDKKVYYNHSGYTGGLRERTARNMRDNYSVEMVERAIQGMLPNGRLGRAMAKKLFVYKDEQHNQEAQTPKEITL